MSASADDELVVEGTGAVAAPGAALATGAVDPTAVRSRPGLPAGNGDGNERWSRISTKWTEHAQDILSVAVGVTLIVMAAAILVASIVEFFHEVGPKGLTLAATDLLDKVLLVLIVVEIVHTVILSLRAHALSAQPFIVVGLVAVIRRILFALGSQEKLSAATLGIYIGMVAVFVAGLVAVELFGEGRRRGARDSSGRPLH